MLDKTKEFSSIYGGTGTTRFIQDGMRYNSAGKFIGRVGEVDFGEKPVQSISVIMAPESIDTMDKAQLIELATSHGIRANGRMSEDTIRSKLKSQDGDIS